MNDAEMKELERILTTEEELQPMTGFSTRVMRAVREEAEATAPIAFPWARFLPGFVLSFGLLFCTAVWMLLEIGPPSSASPVPTTIIPFEWFSHPQAQGIFFAALAMIGTGVLTWITLKWTAPRRTMFF